MKSSLKYILIFSIMFLLLFYFPVICMWMETHEEYYPTVIKMKMEREKPQFLPDNAINIHMLHESDNNNWWVMCKAKKFEASIDTVLFSLTSVTSNEIRILSPSNSINCEINKAEEFYKNNDPQIIKIKSPPFVTWWSEELKEDADLMETADKFVFYRSKEPYKVLGYTNPPSRVKYTVIAHDSGSELIYIWNML